MFPESSRAVVLRPAQLTRVGTWQTTPSVILCASSPASPSEIYTAMEWWEQRGHRFEIASVTSPAAVKICNNVWDSLPFGYIVITATSAELT